MAIQMRRGNFPDLDPSKLLPGEWAVSLDKKYVHMCFAVGTVARMATYEAFEEDMEKVQLILATCEDIQTAVEEFEQLASQHATQAEAFSVESESWAAGGTGTRTGEDADNSRYYSQQSKSQADRAKDEADRAASIVDIDIATVNKPGISKPDGSSIFIDADGTIRSSRRINIAGDTLDINMINLSSGKEHKLKYINTTTSGSANILNIPVTNTAFILDIDLVRYITTTDYITRQIFVAAAQSNRRYERWCTNGVWSSWTIVNPPPITNNLLANVAGTVLDAMQGKALDDKITTLNSKLTLADTYHDFFTPGQFYGKYTKRGGIVIVHLYCEWAAKDTSPAYTDIGVTLPLGYRPSSFFFDTYYDDKERTILPIVVATEGTIRPLAMESGVHRLLATLVFAAT